MFNHWQMDLDLDLDGIVSLISSLARLQKSKHGI
jgi:hypothetical protein